ncbi:sodium:sulfate symporter-like transmembrane protein [Lentzea atacamensis]|uniref:Sodium:sulfate symporter-like transmembrane protein n=1 Tax=Lentzea atacamensis TaxID=531938 RepID=A0A316I6H4_9PSEU|nr:SLC13 family permease [Lentzea atacamensis]PWK82811.1 sodium:sulfate symporter-like transmembrane protein [Lentzea atacamensis]
MILTLVVFGVAVLLWVCTPLDDTFVALAAVAALLLFGVLPASSLAALGGATTWLLLAAFVLAAGVTASGLTTRLATWLVGRARTVRGLAHLVSLGLLLSAFFVPSTSGRAALALPVFGALAEGLKNRRRVVRALGVLFPSVILLTAVATLVGAGAHLITNSLLETATGHGIGFGWWLLLGVPLAVVSAHLTAEIVLWLFTTREDRARPLQVEVAAEQATVEMRVPALVGAARSEGPLPGVPCSDSPTQHRQFRTLELAPPPLETPEQPRADGTSAAKSWRRRTPALTRQEWTALTVVLAVSAAWLTEPWHHIPPEVSALTGALLITAPRLGTTTFKAAFAEVPWSLLVFMAATTALGTALIKSGAADLAAGHLGGGSDLRLLATVIGVSLAAHLVIQSRSARSSVLIPIVIPLALAAGMNPAALAFASTAAAGFCHTLTSSAKPVALFADAYRPKDLLKLSAVLAPVTGLLVFAAAVLLWPYLGLPLK